MPLFRWLSLGLGACVGLELGLELRAEDPQPQVERLQSSPVLRGLQRNKLAESPRTPAEETLAQMYLPEGFRADLVVAEPDIHQPIAFAFDERGRLWVAEAYSYPQKQPAGQGLDKIVIFADQDGDGKYETRRVFAENLNLVSGLEVGYGGVWVGAAPELLFISDRNRDDVPDGPPEILLEGFGYQDTHECLNSFMWGPDGWLYGNQGVFNYARIGKPGTPDADRLELRAGVWRYHPVRHEFEIFAEGGSNQWGLDYDERGQIFMTHCRSYWGRGGTTHVLQGGQFWNQANANYAPFIIAEPPAEFPDFKNYLLASARYDHGAGGAGAPGTDAIYGGHSHVGTMIYLGDNWPDEYRGRLFTHNLHGHQINQQVNRPWGSGFDTVHAGRDIFFCTDPKYVAVDLQYGPDGGVYFIDWYDQQHCHNPNTERWDRGNGRVYRMVWSAGYKPRNVDLGRASDRQLVELQTHKNQWHARTARRLLHERAAAKGLEPSAATKLHEMTREPSAARRLNALWAGHLTGLGDRMDNNALGDPDEYIRAWGIQLVSESKKIDPSTERLFAMMARRDPSAVVRRHLASALPRLSEGAAWNIAEALAQHGEDREDRNIPKLLWQGIAPRIPGNLDRAFKLAETTLLPSLRDWIYWYAATLEGSGLERSIALLADRPAEDRKRLLAGIVLALKSRADVPAPAAWGEVSKALYGSSDASVVRQAELIAAAFGDDSMFPRLRTTLASAEAPRAQRDHAFAVLGRTPDRGSLATFLKLLDDPAFRPRAIRVLARLTSPEIAPALMDRLGAWPDEEKRDALNTLTSKAAFALPLLERVAAGQIKREQLTAFHIRQMTDLKNAEIDAKVSAQWGRITRGSEERQAQIAALEKVFNEAPLWAFDGRAGRGHFEKLCIQCHQPATAGGARIGPDLTGSGRNGIRYFLENIIDPNAVVGTDFQMTTIEKSDGESLSGLVIQETASALVIRTIAGEVTVAKSTITQRTLSDRSLMPEGLLEGLKDREQIELLKFLTEH